MMPGGVVKFKNMDQFVASSESAPKSTNLTHPNADRRDVPGRPLDYYSILLEAINGAKQNSAQLRALVYERARFNLKRDVLFGYSSMGLADVVRQINEFELAVARIEASAVEDPLPQFTATTMNCRSPSVIKPRLLIAKTRTYPKPPMSMQTTQFRYFLQNLSLHSILA